MNDMKKSRDKRLVLLDALIRYADECGKDNPEFYKDEMLRNLKVCEHVFNIMHIQLGEKYCRVIDPYEERTRYAINVDRCLDLRNQITRENKKKMKLRERIDITVLATLIGVFFAILFFNTM